MFKFVFLAALAFVQFAQADVNQATAKYEAAGKNLLALINGGKVTEKEAAPLVAELESSAITLIDAYIKKDPKSKKLLEFLKSNVGKMKSATFAQLQADWHDAGALTKDKVDLDLSKEENEKYLDPCHVLIHPLMTLRAIKDGNLGGAKEELNEGLEQVVNVKKQLAG